MQNNPLFIRGVTEFQTRSFYQCHDTLEELWMDASEPNKTFVQGILQIAVACYHLENQNQKGAMILLGEGIKRLKDYQPEFERVDVKTLVNTSASFLNALQQRDIKEYSSSEAWFKAVQWQNECHDGLSDEFQLPQLQWVKD